MAPRDDCGAVSDTRWRRDEDGVLCKVLLSRSSIGSNFALGLSGSEGAGAAGMKRRVFGSILLFLAAEKPSEDEDAPLDHGLLGFALGFSGSEEAGGAGATRRPLGDFLSAVPSIKAARSSSEDEEARRMVW